MVNAAILASQAQEVSAKLPMLLKMALWQQHHLARHVTAPHLVHLVTAELQLPPPVAHGSLSAASLQAEEMEEEMLDTGSG